MQTGNPKSNLNPNQILLGQTHLPFFAFLSTADNAIQIPERTVIQDEVDIASILELIV